MPCTALTSTAATAYVRTRSALTPKEARRCHAKPRRCCAGTPVKARRCHAEARRRCVIRAEALHTGFEQNKAKESTTLEPIELPAKPGHGSVFLFGVEHSICQVHLLSQLTYLSCCSHRRPAACCACASSSECVLFHESHWLSLCA